MKTILTQEESDALIAQGFDTPIGSTRFRLEDLIELLDKQLDGYHYEFVRYYDGWEVSGDFALQYKRCPELINAIAGTLYLWKKQKDE